MAFVQDQAIRLEGGSGDGQGQAQYLSRGRKAGAAPQLVSVFQVEESVLVVASQLGADCTSAAFGGLLHWRAVPAVLPAQRSADGVQRSAGGGGGGVYV